MFISIGNPIVKLRSVIALGLTSAMVFTLGCSGKTKSDGASIEINPERPIVIGASIKIGSDETEIVGPWFKFTVPFDNQTDEIITVVSVQTEVTGTSENGRFETVDGTYDPSTNNYSTDFIECNYRHYGEFAPKNRATGSPTTDDLLHLASGGGNPTGCATGTVTFYAQGNPDPGTGGSYNFSGKLKVVGWFGTYENPTDRFEKTVYFSTQ